MIYATVPEVIYEHYGKSVISVKPGSQGQPGSISAIFTDDNGEKCFEIRDNEWIGRNDLFDLEIVGQRFTLKRTTGRTVLKLRHEPPGKIIIEHLDMRYGNIHILATQNTLAVGRYNGYGNNLIWVHANVRIDNVFRGAKAIATGEMAAKSSEYEKGLTAFKPKLVLNQTMNPNTAMSSLSMGQYNAAGCGIWWPAMGIQIGKNCELALNSFLTGVSSIEHARRHFFLTNKMNIPHAYLPSSFNRECLEREFSQLKIYSSPDISLPDPFLFLEDMKGLKEWNSRARQQNTTFKNTPFVDDEPGCCSAYGITRLSEKYNGPLIRAAKYL